MITLSYLLMTLLGFSGLFLIGLILLQRGRGGGLAGAFGGMGGQSAFGTKAGDVFTRITIGVASAWILLCAGSVLALNNAQFFRFDKTDAPDAVIKAPAKEDEANAKENGVKPPGGLLKKVAPAAVGKPAEKDDAVLPAPAVPGDKVDGETTKPEGAAKPEVDDKANDAKPDGANGDDKKPTDAQPEAKKSDAKPE